MPFVHVSLILSLSSSICKAWAKLCHSTLSKRYLIPPVRTNMLGVQCQPAHFSIKSCHVEGITHAQGLMYRLWAYCSQRPCLSLWAGWVLDCVPWHYTSLASSSAHDLIFPCQTPFSSHSHWFYFCPYYFISTIRKNSTLYVSIGENCLSLHKLHHLSHLFEYDCSNGWNRWELIFNERGSKKKRLVVFSA